MTESSSQTYTTTHMCTHASQSFCPFVNTLPQTQVLTNNLLFNEEKIYKASYTQQPQVGWKKYTCIVPISIGSPAHEGEKFLAVLKLISKTFGECIIMVCDSLHRHSLAIDHYGSSGEKLYQLSLTQGKEWIERSANSFASYLTIPYKILRWDYWLNIDSYKEYRNKLNNMFKADEIYAQAFHYTANSFVAKIEQKRTLSESERVRALELSLEYLKEESVIACLWHDYGYRFIVYPGNNRAITETLKNFKSSITHLSYRLKSKKKNTYNLAYTDNIPILDEKVYA